MRLIMLAVLATVGCGGSPFTSGDPSAALIDPAIDAATVTVDSGAPTNDSLADAPTIDSGVTLEAALQTDAAPVDSAAPDVVEHDASDAGCTRHPTFLGTTGYAPFTTISATTPKACACDYTCDCLTAQSTFCSVAGAPIASCAVAPSGELNITCGS